MKSIAKVVLRHTHAEKNYLTAISIALDPDAGEAERLLGEKALMTLVKSINDLEKIIYGVMKDAEKEG